MKRMLGVLAVAALAGIMSISSVEAAPKHKTRLKWNITNRCIGSATITVMFL